MDVMRLDGGIDTYSYNGMFDGQRYEDGESPFGRKVVYLNDNGYDNERAYANQFFKEGQVLTVKEIYAGRNRSEIEFVEFPGKQFNHVMFADYDGEDKPNEKL